MDATDLRLARLSDAPAIAAFTSDTFSWGDYVADEFPSWLHEPEMGVVVATDGSDRPIAVARVRMLSRKEGWLSAARVHPDHRRKGLGSALNNWCVEWIAGRGGAVARLQIETWNEAAHNQVLGLGYRPVMGAVNAERPVGTDPMHPDTNGGRRTRGEERLDRAPQAEADLAYIAWSTSDLARASRGMFPVDLWAWRQMTEHDVSGTPIWFCPAGWVMADREDDQMIVRWPVTTLDDAPLLIKAITDLAHEKGIQRLHMAGPDVPWLTSALETHAFECHPSRIYAKTL